MTLRTNKFTKFSNFVNYLHAAICSCYGLLTMVYGLFSNTPFQFKNLLLHLHLFYKEVHKMKKDLHPSNYRLVVFKDMSNDYSFLTKSCIDTRESVKWEDGNEYPLVKLEISHTSHPFYTGKMKLVDTAGRIDKFRTRYNKK